MTLLDDLLGRRSGDLRDEVATMIGRLAAPLSDEELRQGWSSEKKQKWLDWFTNLDQQLASEQPLQPHNAVARAMDFDGIGGGSLSDLAVRISNRLDAGERYR